MLDKGEKMSQESIEQIIDKVLLVYANNKPGDVIEGTSKATVEQLLGNGSEVNQEAVMKLYTQKLLEVENGNESSRIVVEKINLLINYIYDENKINASFATYLPRAMSFYGIIGKELFKFCKDNHIEDWSPESICIIERMINGLAKFVKSPTIFDNFTELEDRINSKGKYFSSSVKQSFLNTTVIAKKLIEVNHLMDFELIKSIPGVEAYFLRYTREALEKKGVECIWNDDIVNLVLQLRNTKRISEKYPDNPELKALDAAAEAFCERNFSQEIMLEKYARLGTFIGEHALHKLNNPREESDFEDIYKLLYVYELVSDKQKDITPYANFFDLFIFRQIDSFKAMGRVNNSNVNRLLMRAIQSTIIKETQKDFYDGEEKIDSPVVVKIDENFLRQGYAASAAPKVDILTVSKTVPDDDKLCQRLIFFVYHEMDHYIKNKKAEMGEVKSFEEYKVYKNEYGKKLNLSVHIANYSNQYSEINANCIGHLAIIRALRMFPAGENDSDIQSKIDIEIDAIKKLLESTVDNQLRWHDKTTGRLESDNDVLAYDANFKNADPSERPPIFDFEYRDDGTPKELFEIIMDQQREIETGEIHPDCGPKNSIERAKIRFQIMMERAMATHQEKMCYLIMLDYVKQHKEQFQEDDLFKIDFPDGEKISEFDFDRLIVNFLKDGKQAEFQNALFLYRLQEMAKRVKLKEEFGESVFSFYERAFGIERVSQGDGVILTPDD